MEYLKFDKAKLVNLEYALQRELLRTNRKGSYACSTIIDCNTRKYHGLLAADLPDIDGGKHMLINNLHETIVHNDMEFNLGIHKYAGGNYEPKGHKYIQDFDAEDIPTLTYSVGDVILKKEKILDDEHDRILIRYEVVETSSPITFRLRPFLSFRNIHSLTKANMYANTRIEMVRHGIRMKLYEGYPFLYMQINTEPDYIHVPDWYYNVEYAEEQNRGYDYKEDLFTPGFFETKLRKGESIVFAAGTEEMKPSGIKHRFTSLRRSRTPRVSFENCLINSAQQFIERHNKTATLVSGYPWYGSDARQTMISLPGITLSIGDIDSCKKILNSYIRKMSGPMFPTTVKDTELVYDQIDAPLWFFHTLQELEKAEPRIDIYDTYGDVMKTIINGYRSGTKHKIKMNDYALIYGAGDKNTPLSWMNATVKGKAVTPRKGMQVEVQALWYNALRYTYEKAEEKGDTEFTQEWFYYLDVVKNSFMNRFWDDEKGYLGDFSSTKDVYWDVTPNQIIAAALPYSMLTDEQKEKVIKVVRQQLLTPKGLRTLSPAHVEYQPHYQGTQFNRDMALHRGTAWPWLLEFYAKALFQFYGVDALEEILDIYHAFEEEMTNHGIGTISEIYDGDPPHTPRGAVSQAWSVGALLQIRLLIQELLVKKQG
jgi:predicted glycogen debranching enzyme